LAELHAQAVGGLGELQTALSRYAEKVDVDPARLAELEERLNLLQSLRRKYGSSLAEVIAFGAEARQKLQGLESRDAEVARINGRDGDDAINGDGGDDTLTGGAGDETFVFALGAGHDVITDFVAGGAEDELSLRL
jgi:DNA repair protein RecN (Recombination protein N)